MPTKESLAAAEALARAKYPSTGHWLSDTKDILIKFLQEFLNSMPPNMGLFHYTPKTLDEIGETAEVDTEVIISDGGALNTDTIEKRPVIIISRGPFAYGNLGLDNLVHLNETNEKRTHTDLLSGTYVINCISRNGLEAERLALLVAKGIKVYRRELQLAGFFHIGHVVSVGGETPANFLLPGDSDEDFVTVPVQFPIFYQETWKVTPTNLELLNKITTEVQSVAENVDGSLLYPDSINSDGTINTSSDGVIVQAWTVTAS